MCAQKGVPWQSHTVRQHQYYKATWTLCVDFISLKPDESGTKDILLIADHFTKYATAIATCNQNPSTYNSTKTEMTGFANLSLVVSLHSTPRTASGLLPWGYLSTESSDKPVRQTQGLKPATRLRLCRLWSILRGWGWDFPQLLV